MPSTRMTRPASNARSQILEQLMQDHKRVKKAYRDFQKLDIDADAESCEALVLQVLDELTVHAALEEELLYPAARGVIADDDLIDEAEVEHEGMHTAIERMRSMAPSDDKYAARFTVLCEYVLHHVKEEESQMFPLLERARLDWESLAAQMTERRAELTGADAQEAEPEEGGEDESAAPVGPRAKPARSGPRVRAQSV